MEDGELVLATLPKVLTLIRGEHVKDALEGLRALRRAAEISPTLFRGTAEILSVLFETSLSVGLSKDAAVECADTLVDIAGALATFSDESAKCQELISGAISRLLEQLQRGEARNPAEFFVLRFTVCRCFDSSRLWFLSYGEKRHDLLRACLDCMRECRSSQLFHECSLLVRSIVASEVDQPTGGIGVLLGITVVRLLYLYGKELESSAAHVETVELLSERNARDGIVALSTIFESKALRELRERADEAGNIEAWPIWRTLCRSLAKLLRNTTPGNAASVQVFALRAIREHFLPLLRERDYSVVSACIAEVLDSAIATVNVHEKRGARPPLSIAKELEATETCVKALCAPPLGVSYRDRAQTLIGVGELLSAMKGPWSHDVNDKYRVAASQVLLEMSSKIDSQNVSSSLSIELSEVFCRYCGNTTPIHVVASAVASVMQEGELPSAQIAKVLGRLPVPKSKVDAQHLLKSADLTAARAKSSQDRSFLAVACKLLALVSSSNIEEARVAVPDRVRSILPWIASTLSSQNSIPDSEDSLQSLANLICASAICPSQSTGSCFGTCPVDIWNSMLLQIERAMLDFSPRTGLVFLRAVGKLFEHGDSTDVSGLGSVASATLQKLWSESTAVRDSAAKSAPAVLNVAAMLPLKSERASGSMNEDSTDFLTERDTILWDLTEQLKDLSLHGDFDAYIDALRNICSSNLTGEVQVIAMDLLISEVLLDTQNGADRNMKAYNCLVEVSRKFSSKRQSAAAVAQMLRGLFRDLLPLFLNRFLEDENVAVEMSMLTDMDVQEDLWSELPKHVLPRLVRSGDLDMITKLSERLGKLAEELLQQSLPECLGRCLLSRSTKGRRLVENITGSDFAEVVYENEGEVTALVVWELSGRRPAAAQKALENLAGRASLLVFLTRNFLRVMDGLNITLFTSTLRADQARALASLGKLLELCKGEVHVFIPKVMATLKLAIDIDDDVINSKALMAWETFLSCLTAKQAASNLASILSVLLARYSTLDASITQHISRFIRDAEDGAQMPEVLLLLGEYKIPELEHVSIKYGRLAEEHNSLAWLCKCATENESTIVRKIAMEKLLSMLRGRRGGILRDPYLPTLLQSLTKALSFADGDYRLLCLSSLSEIGAPDPSQVFPNSRPDKKEETAELPALPEDLARELLQTYLVPALRRGESKGGGERQNQVGFSIQEILRMHGCDPSTPAAPQATKEAVLEDRVAWSSGSDEEVKSWKGILFWSQLREDVRTTVKPYLEANFESTFLGGRNRILSQKLPDRLKILKYGMDSSSWVKEFTARIIDTLEEGSLISGILIACRVVVRNDYATALFCLPHAIVALVDGAAEEEAATTVSTELLTALRHERETAQVVFLVLDVLVQLTDEKKKRGSLECDRRNMPGRAAIALATKFLNHFRTQYVFNSASGKSSSSRSFETPLDKLSPFSEESLLPPDSLVAAARRVSANTRAVLYLEEGIRRKDNTRPERGSLRKLEEVYSDLEDGDDLSGIASVMSSLGNEEMYIQAESLGNYDDQLFLCEEALFENPSDEGWNLRYLQCLKLLGHFETMLSHSQSTMRRRGVDVNVVAPHVAEAAWRLSRWDVFDDIPPARETGTQLDWETNFEMRLGQMFLFFSRKDRASFEKSAAAARQTILRPLATASIDGYGHTVKILGKAHIVELVADAVQEQRAPLLAELDDRVAAMATSLKVREPVLSARIAALELAGRRASAAEVSATLAKTARKLGNFKAATAAANRAQAMGAANGTVELAKLQFIRGHTLTAIKMLSKAISRSEETSSRRDELESKRVAKLRLKLGSWMEETKSYPPSEILANYRAATEMAPNTEKPSYMLGRYFDVLLTATQRAPSEKPTAFLPSGARAQPMIPKELSASEGTAASAYEYLPLIIENWRNALRTSEKHVHQILPRVLTLWFNFFSAVYDKTDTKISSETEKRVTAEFKRLAEDLPRWLWLSTMPQLLSRLLHPSRVVQDAITDLLASITAALPDQSLWYLVPVTRSRDAARAARAKGIVHKAVEKARDPRVSEVLGAGSSLVKELIRVCIQQIPQKTRTIRASVNLRGLLRLLPSIVAIPTRQALSPSGDTAYASDGLTTFESVEDTVQLMPSLMKPKKVSFIGSDGHVYVFLCKREDSGDMRKDARLMDFAQVVNRLLAQDTQSRQRSLNLRTYEVLPLNEECGLVGWVNNLVSLRSAYYTLYKARGFTTNYQEIMKAKEKKTCSDVEFFDEWLVPLFPPLLHRFFVQNYRDASKWFEARRAFTRSAAVWSMTGYVIGLGDRHGENITIEMGSGACVHVDFACLFDKGLTLKVPELVPFRLTRNMLDAMGIHAPEGSFRSVAEITLRCLRQHKEALMSVLETFLHDPLVEWNSSASSKSKAPSKPVENAYAVKTLRAVEMKLEGIAGSGLPLSIAGQVQRLVHEATSGENLSKMYIGWMAWI